jgi:hypothetical protein
VRSWATSVEFALFWGLPSRNKKLSTKSDEPNQKRQQQGR